jgi:hypothetical protein
MITAASADGEPINWGAITKQQKYSLANNVLFQIISDDKPNERDVFARMHQSHWSSEYRPLGGPAWITFSRLVEGETVSASAACVPDYFEGLLKAALRAHGIAITDISEPNHL